MYVCLYICIFSAPEKTKTYKKKSMGSRLKFCKDHRKTKSVFGTMQETANPYFFRIVFRFSLVIKVHFTDAVYSKAPRRIPEDQHLPSVVVQGDVSTQGAVPLYFAEGVMRQEQYLKVLKQVFMPYAEQNRGSQDEYICIQDDALCHIVKSIKLFLSQKTPLWPWPVNFPYLNPIENVWQPLKFFVYLHNN